MNTLAANVLVTVGHPAFLSILGSRLLLHMKEAGEKGVNEGTSYRVENETNMQFAQIAAQETTESTFVDQEVSISIDKP